MRKVLFFVLGLCCSAAFAGAFLATTSSSSGTARAHFNSEVSRLTTAGDLIVGKWYENQTEIDDDSTVEDNQAVRYDPVEDAAKVIIEENKHDLNDSFGANGSSVTADLGALYLENDGDELWVQFQQKWPSGANGWTPIDGGIINDYKLMAFRSAGGAKMLLELRVRFNMTDDTAVGVADVRAYQPADPVEQCSNSPCEDTVHPAEGAHANLQPGGDTWSTNSQDSDKHRTSAMHMTETSVAWMNDPPGTEKPFLFMPDKWIEITIHLIRSGGKLFLRLYMSDEDTDVAVVIAKRDYTTNATGFELDTEDADWTGDLAAVRSMYHQYDTSDDTGRMGAELHTWFRGLIVATSEINRQTRPVP